jgi:GNAT superfamily N-acetyltransferase
LSNVAFRKAHFCDHTRIAALHVASWRNAYRGSLPENFLNQQIEDERLNHWKTRLSAPDADRRCVLLAEYGDKLLGFACVLLDEAPHWGACLDNLHVNPAFKRQRLGRHLFAMAVRWVLEKEPGWPLHLWVFEGNLGARCFYEDVGGQAVSCERKRMPGGVFISSVRYVWRDLEKASRDLARFLNNGH